ncbi:MAG: hypothetical protein H6672_15075 [Anaerolineaceae bacterium]|nr:hypothetical protein [Anaerolineaceae bacterium]
MRQFSNILLIVIIVTTLALLSVGLYVLFALDTRDIIANLLQVTFSAMSFVLEIIAFPGVLASGEAGGTQRSQIQRPIRSRIIIWIAVTFIVSLGLSVLIIYKLTASTIGFQDAVVISNVAILYDGPGENYPITASVEKDKHLIVIAQVSNSPIWYLVQGFGKDPWVRAEDVELLSPNVILPTAKPSQTPTQQPKAEIIATSSVPLYEGPGDNYPIGRYANQTEHVIILARIQYGYDIWYLIEVPGDDLWVKGSDVRVIPDNSVIGTAVTIPPSPTNTSTATSTQTASTLTPSSTYRPTLISPVTSTPTPVCNPGQWNAVCGSNGCPADNVSECNSEGSGWICRWNPSECSVEAPPPFKPPTRPTLRPGETPEPCTCTQSWLEALIRSNGYEPKDLIPAWDLDHDGQITCNDYKLLMGTDLCYP